MIRARYKKLTGRTVWIRDQYSSDNFKALQIDNPDLLVNIQYWVDDNWKVSRVRIGDLVLK